MLRTVRRRLYLMRHAEVSYVGEHDPEAVSLTERGREQAAAAHRALRDVDFDLVVTSSLPRTRETAEVVVDLSGVTFLDSSGISALVKQRRLADEHGKLMRISGAGGTVRDVLRLTGVWQHLGARDA